MFCQVLKIFCTMNLLHRQQPVHNRRQVRKTERKYHQINRHQDNQTHKNKQTDQSTNTKPTNDKHTSNRLSKGSNDAVNLHNKFGVFEEADDMEFEETPTRPRAPNSRSISQSILHTIQSSLTSNQKV